MKISFIEEPLLQFGNDFHICPRFGIANFNTYDSNETLIDTKPKEIRLGIIGTQQNFDKFNNWLDICSNFIEAKPSKQANLFTSFCGFNESGGFHSKMVTNSLYQRQINDTEITKLIKEVGKFKNRKEVVKKVALIYLEHIEFLAENKTPQVIICIIPDNLWTKILKVEKNEESDQTEENEEKEVEINFRSFLKAKSMKFRVPIQLIKESSLRTEETKGKGSLQDLATRAWNFCTAIYYKAGGIPWKAGSHLDDIHTCFVGISFYRSLDKLKLETSLAQVFDEQGKGVILRGSPVQIDKKDRQPHLNEEQAYDLLISSIKGYHLAEGTLPKRIVIHKSSKFTEQEKEGFIKAIEEKEISTFDFVTIYESKIRLFRTGNYPPLRGTCIELTENQHLLYTKSSVEFYQTYAGMYIPEPIEIRIEELNSSPKQICDEVLSLTKMNWNRTQFDGKIPITIDCSRSVGAIMKYLDEGEVPNKRYGFYM